MKRINFSWDHSQVSKQVVRQLAQRLVPECARIKDAWGAGYATPYASLSLSSDDALLCRIHTLVRKKRTETLRAVIVIGMGGSILGARAVCHALRIDPLPLVYFMDMVGGLRYQQIYTVCDAILETGEDILVVVISKSGTTTETIFNAQIYASLLIERGRRLDEAMVIITDEGSPLWDLAQQERMACLSIPKQVGGRYSVFSSAGLFPLGVIGFDMAALCRGAESMKEACTSLDIMRNSAALSAAIIYEQYCSGAVIHDTFLFSDCLQGVADWYRQLMGESIGKISIQAEPVRVGITPTTSIGPSDLHSVAQLYLAGPYNRLTTFVSVLNKKGIDVKEETPFSLLVPMIRNKSAAHVVDAIERGIQEAYVKEKRPFVCIEMPEITEYTLGQLMQFYMVQMMYLGFLLEVNPFDQPQVELYKKETRKMLNHE